MARPVGPGALRFSPYRGRGDRHPVVRRSPRRPWRYAPDMAVMLDHAMGTRSKARDRVAIPVRASALLLLIYLAFCVAEHRRDLGVERQGRRESLAGPGMAHQGGPLNPEKHRAPAAGRPRIRLAFFLVPSFLANQKR